MKKLFLVSFAILVSFCVYGKFTYDPSKGTIVDEVNGWTFKVALKNTNELYLLSGEGCSYTGPEQPCSLNLTEITDAGGKTYKAVSFKALPAEAKPYLTEFIAPEVTVIGEGAFHSCSVLTSVSMPKIKQIMNQAFQNCTSLTTESVNGMMHRGVELLASSAGAKSVAFGGCTSIEGPLIWNMPQLQTNVVWYSMFSSCSNLREVRILSEVAEIREAAFKNIAPGASVYMPLKAPAVYGVNAVARNSAPYPKVYLKGNFEDWFAVMGDKHQVLPKERFNDTTWTPTTTTTTRAKILVRMSADTEMCTATKTGGTITEITAKDKNVIAFVAYNDDGYCWVLKMPEQGFRVIVR